MVCSRADFADATAPQRRHLIHFGEKQSPPGVGRFEADLVLQVIPYPQRPAEGFGAMLAQGPRYSTRRR